MMLTLLLVACTVRPTPPGPSPIEQRAAVPEPLVMSVEGSEIVYLQATVRAGSAADPVGQEGVAWLTARMLREGGTASYGAEDLDAALYALGTDVSILVDKELVTFRAKVLADDFDAFLPLFTEIVTAPAFDPAAFERLRTSALDELTQGILDSDEVLGWTVLDTWLHEGHPYGHPVQGRAGVLPTLTLDDVRAFYDTRYTRDATTLGIAGATTPERAAALAEPFSALSEDPWPAPTPKPRPVLDDRQLLVVEKPSPATGIHFGHPLDVTRDHPDYAALLVGVTALGQHRESIGRLYRALRGERGLNYGDYAYIEHFPGAPGYKAPRPGVLRVQPHFTVWLRPVAPENGPFALKLATRMTEQWVAEGLEPEEFEQIKAYLAARIGLWGQSPGDRLAWAVEAQALGTPDPLVDLAPAVRAVTLEEVNAAIAAHIHPETLRIVAVTQDVDAFVRPVIEETPTAVVYTDSERDTQTAAVDAEAAGYTMNIAGWTTVPAEGIFR
ncbi:MAG: insulinase family protein [Alphaproteobacteria bacterium]|nr:insulinase family protein [Alphaproteobacteria bacterium]